MDVEFYERIRLEISDLLARIGHLLPADTVDDVRIFADAAEFGLAVDQICQQLYEYDKTLDQQSFASLKSLVEDVRVDFPLLSRLAAPNAEQDSICRPR